MKTPNLKNFFRVKTLIIVLSVIAFLVNAAYLCIYVKIKLNDTRSIVLEPGLHFGEIRELVKGQKRVGFMSNKNLTRESNDGDFLQAQFYLAPTILELDNPNNKYTILDYTNQIFVFYVVKKHQLEPIYDSNYGKVLTIHKQ